MTNTEYKERLHTALIQQNSDVDEAELHRINTYIDKLFQSNLPVLFDKNHVCEVLQMSDVQFCYHTFNIGQAKKTRIITAPCRSLKIRQRWILDNILSKIQVSDYAHGFEDRKSILTNATPHLNHGYVLCVDIKNFFPSIKQCVVVQFFQQIGYSISASRELADICCFQGELPQGAPSSPKIANLICTKFDVELGKLAQANQATYTRYADDMTFSSNVPIKHLLPTIIKILFKYGFHLNANKTHYYEPEDVKRITGLIVHQNRVRVPKEFKRKLKQEIYYCVKYGVQIHLENIGAKHSIHYREYLYGKAYYIHMIEKQEGEKFLEELDQIEWPSYML